MLIIDQEKISSRDNQNDSHCGNQRNFFTIVDEKVGKVSKYQRNQKNKYFRVKTQKCKTLL